MSSNHLTSPTPCRHPVHQLHSPSRLPTVRWTPTPWYPGLWLHEIQPVRRVPRPERMSSLAQGLAARRDTPQLAASSSHKPLHLTPTHFTTQKAGPWLPGHPLPTKGDLSAVHTRPGPHPHPASRPRPFLAISTWSLPLFEPLNPLSPHHRKRRRAARPPARATPPLHGRLAPRPIGSLPTPPPAPHVASMSLCSGQSGDWGGRAGLPGPPGPRHAGRRAHAPPCPAAAPHSPPPLSIARLSRKTLIEPPFAQFHIKPRRRRPTEPVAPAFRDIHRPKTLPLHQASACTTQLPKPSLGHRINAGSGQTARLPTRTA